MPLISGLRLITCETQGTAELSLWVMRSPWDVPKGGRGSPGHCPCSLVLKPNREILRLSPNFGEPSLGEPLQDSTQPTDPFRDPSWIGAQSPILA